MTANASSHDVSVLRGNGDGTYRAPQSYDAGLGTNSLALADIDGNGFLDLVTTSTQNSEVSVLLHR